MLLPGSSLEGLWGARYLDHYLYLHLFIFQSFLFSRRGRVEFLFYVCVGFFFIFFFFHSKKLESAMCVYIIYKLCTEGGRGVHIAQRTWPCFCFIAFGSFRFRLGVAGFYSPPPPPPPHTHTLSIFVVTFVFAFIVFEFCWCVF